MPNILALHMNIKTWFHTSVYMLHLWFHWLYKPADQQTNLDEKFQNMRSFLLFNNSDQDLVGFTGWSGSSSKDILVSILQSTLKETTKSEPKFTQKTSHLTSQHQFLKCVDEFLLIKTPLQQNSTQKTRYLTITHWQWSIVIPALIVHKDKVTLWKPHLHFQKLKENSHDWTFNLAPEPSSSFSEAPVLPQQVLKKRKENERERGFQCLQSPQGSLGN